MPDEPIRPNATLAEFARLWLRGRGAATRQSDNQRLRDHFLSQLGTRRLRELRAEELTAAVQQMLAKKGMTVKSARNAYGVFAELIADALARGLLSEDPRSPVSWPEDEVGPAPTFTASEVAALCGDERLELDQRLYNTLAFYSGLDSAAICLRRFEDGQQGFATPVAPELAAALQHWQQQGFERTFGRAPTGGDWLIPRRSDVTQPHGEGSAFKAFRRACVALKIKLRSPRAIQHTFAPARAEQGNKSS